MRNLLLGFVAACLMSGPAHAADTPPFVFTGIPNQDESRLVERFGKIASYLQQKLGVPVKYIPVKNYPAAVTAFTNGQVQLAWFGGFTGVQARKAVPGSVAIARGGRRRLQDLLHRQHQARPEKSQEFPKETAGKPSASVRAPRPRFG